MLHEKWAGLHVSLHWSAQCISVTFSCMLLLLLLHSCQQTSSTGKAWLVRCLRLLTTFHSAHWFIYSFIYSIHSIISFIPFIYSVHSFIYSFSHSFIPFLHSFHLSISSFFPSFIHSFVDATQTKVSSQHRKIY